MEQSEATEPTQGSTGQVPSTPGGTCGCAGRTEAVDTETATFVYVLGRIGVRFNSLCIEKEFAQAAGRTETTGLTDHQAFHRVLSQRQNRYLARRMCWVLSVEGIDTYLIVPRGMEDLDLLLEALRPAPRPTDVDVVIGMRGPIAPPSMCNGLQLPILVPDQIYSFDVDTLMRNIPRPDQISAETFQAAAEELFFRIMQLADNGGATDEHRALNYLSVRYPAIYSLTAELHGRNSSLSGVEVRPSRLSGLRRIVDVIFTFNNRSTDVMEKYFVRTDVTEEFPFLVTKLSPFYER